MLVPFDIDEKERLQTLYGLNLLNTSHEERFERITRLACHIFSVPYAAFILMDKGCLWFKSAQGLPVKEMLHDLSFCSHTLSAQDVIYASDIAQDIRFSDVPNVIGDKHIRFYAGCPVNAPNGSPVGIFCVVDTEPREATSKQLEHLKDLVSWIETELRVQQLSSLQKDLLSDLDTAQTLIAVDPLTRLWNRQGIYELIRRRWHECIRTGDLVVVVMADIDHFKRINDTYGHDAGDVVIQSIACQLLTSIRAADAVGRVGGEEFLILLTGCEASELKRTVERIRLSVASSNLEVNNGTLLNVTLSFGVAAAVPGAFSSFEELIKFADEALYNAKKGGRNRVEIKGLEIEEKA